MVLIWALLTKWLRKLGIYDIDPWLEVIKQ